MTRWTFTDLEFKLLCDEYRHGNLPAPFVFTSRTPRLDDYEREKADTRQRLRTRFDGEFDAMAAAIAAPEVFVVAHAWNDQEFENPQHRIRVHAVRHGARGYLLTQKPGETLWHSGGFTIEECDPRALGEVVTGRLPPAESGTQPDLVVHAATPDAGYEPTGSMISDDDEPDEDDNARSAAFFAAPATATGIVKVLQGRSKFGPRGRVESGVLWRDLPADGRYVMPLDDPTPVATGMGTTRLAAWVDREIERILARMEQHHDTVG
ncbi:ESX secretion-associated protein EspG [Nocardia blacklockiae]|uniref:ESX secretion-associated protein EspG n=1 Tax=Nocardia blacklockiae TaxID=480036 RepID=UPI001893596D|nr:ESX secretion-associated protein EspG [Nocardia blacklockiae]MBF6171421.1 ESX secretion-associated protein EspG [Nocardia blacklockiae]